MKKILLILFSLILLCSCGTNNEVTEEEIIEEDNNTDVSETISLVNINNEPFDEGESFYEKDFSELLGSDNGIEIYGKNNRSFDFPIDGYTEIHILIKNTNDFDIEIGEDSVSYIDKNNSSGEMADRCNEISSIRHPSDNVTPILANSETEFIYDVSLQDFDNRGQSYDGIITHSLKFHFVKHEDVNVDVGNIDVDITSNIHYMDKSERNSGERRTATLRGKVLDENGNPLTGVEVKVFDAIDEGTDIATTNDHGDFELHVAAHKSNNTNMWHECLLIFNHPDYAEKYVCFYPKTDEITEVDIVLHDKPQELSYTNTKTVDLGIQSYIFDTNDDKNLIAFTPFHTNFEYSDMADKFNLTYTDFDGNVLFKYHLNNETPWVCVSDDGEYVVVSQAIEPGNDRSTYVVILDKNGNEVYKYTQYSPRNQQQIIHSPCSELSHDNKYLAVGSGDGDFWLVDWENDKTLWYFEMHGQIRNIVFNEDDSLILVSSGDGYMYGIDINGNQKFKTYVGSWAPDMELAGNYLVYNMKTSFQQLGCIDISTGEKIWTSDYLDNANTLAISKDKKYVWAGTNGNSAFSAINNAVYDIKTGELAYVLNADAGQEAMYSDDGRYLVVKTSTKLQVFETANYSCVYNATIIEGYDINSASVNQTVAVNADASKIVASYNNDPSSRDFGQAYYFVLN